MKYQVLIFILCAWLVSGCEQNSAILMLPLEEDSLQWVDVQSDASGLATHIDRQARWIVAQSIARAECLSASAARAPHVSVRAPHASARSSIKTTPGAAEGVSSETARPTRRIDINTASLRELQRLPRVGPVLAQAIVDARPYRRIQDLRRVRGIGAKTFESMESQLSVSKEDED